MRCIRRWMWVHCSVMIWASNELDVLKKERPMKALKVALGTRRTPASPSSSWSVKEKGNLCFHL